MNPSPGPACIIRLFALLAIVISAAGCKVRITVPDGGRVVSDSGVYTCNAGQACDIDVTDIYFDETFRAEPEPGLEFIHWQKQASGLCAGLNPACRLITATFPSEPDLMQILESDNVYYLRPYFGVHNSWKARTSMPTARIGFGVCEVNGNIYAIGGYAQGGAPGMATVEEYNPVTDSWRARAPMPTARRWLAVSAAGGRCYAIGGDAGAGNPPLRVVEEYDPATNQWRRRADLPQSKSALASVTFKGTIYVFGGTDTAYDPVGPATATTFVYDPRANAWEARAPMPVASLMMAATVVKDYVYALGGVPGPFTSATATVQRYNPLKDSWSLLSDMPAPRANHMAATVNDKLYVIGGRQLPIGNFRALPAEVYEFDPQAATWKSRAAMPDPRVFLAGGAVGGTIFAIGGAFETVNSHPGVGKVSEMIP